MTMLLCELFNFYRFPAGRRAYALEGIERIATEMGHEHIATLARDFHVAEVETSALSQKWALDKKTNEGVREQAVVLDQKLDRAVSSLFSHLDALSTAFADQEVGQLAQRTVRRIYPRGVAGITQLNYEEQLLKCRDLLNAVRGLEKNELQMLSIEPYVVSIDELTARFKEALDASAKREVSYEDIKARELAGQENLMTVVVLCVAQYPRYTPEHQKLRAKLLAPVLDQQRRLKASYARRTGHIDINPETGEELGPKNGEESVPGGGGEPSPEN